MVGQGCYPAFSSDHANSQNINVVSMRCGISRWPRLDDGPWSVRLAGSHTFRLQPLLLQMAG